VMESFDEMVQKAFIIKLSLPTPLSPLAQSQLTFAYSIGRVWSSLSVLLCLCCLLVICVTGIHGFGEVTTRLSRAAP
jgi:hypothetical protein